MKFSFIAFYSYRIFEVNKNIMEQRQKKEIIAQEWVVRFDGQIKRLEKKLSIKNEKEVIENG